MRGLTKIADEGPLGIGYSRALRSKVKSTVNNRTAAWTLMLLTCVQVCEDAPAQLEVRLSASVPSASAVLVPELLRLLKSSHNGVRSGVRAHCMDPPLTRASS